MSTESTKTSQDNNRINNQISSIDKVKGVMRFYDVRKEEGY